MDTTISFGKVYIIEWLGLGDAKTGWELYDELQPIGLTSKPQVEVSFKRVQTRDEFITYLRTIAEDFRETKRLPLLHIETHGSLRGIGSAEHDEVLWPELMQELIPLNRLTQLRLIVVLAACEGLWGMQMLQPVERAAFLALLGPNEAISAAKLSRACLIFYRSIFQNRNGNAAFQAMNDSVDTAKPTFGMVNAGMLFKRVYQEFLARMCTEPALAQRIDGMMAEWQVNVVGPCRP